MASTALLSEQKSILWSIPSFSKLPKTGSRLIEEKASFEMNVNVTPEAVYNLKWTCFLHISAEKVKKNERRITMFIVLKNLPPELSKCHAKVQFQVADKEKGTYNLDSLFTASMTEMTTKPQFAGINDSETLARSCTNNSTILTNDGTLEIRVTVTVYHPAVQNAELVAVQADYEDWFASNFKNELLGLGSNPLNISSVTTTIVAKDGVQFPVDRVLLAARSPVFRAMFQSNMSEVEDGVVQVKDMDSKPLEVLLHFMQTGELLQNWKNEGIIEGLLYGVHKYMIKDLLQFLNHNIDLVCTNGNCGKLAGLAKTLELQKAQEKLLKYFKKHLANNMDEVLKFAEDTATAARLMVPSDTEEIEGQPQRKRKRRV